MTNIKACTRCKIEKKAGQFYKRSASKDGLKTECKKCTKAYGADYRRKNHERILAINRRYVRKYPDKIAVYQAAYSRIYALKYPERGVACRRRYALKYPEKRKAMEAVAVAIKSNKLKRMPCEVCGNPKSEGHHHSYLPEHHLDVKWLCRKHHREEHVIMAEKVHNRTQIPPRATRPRSSDADPIGHDKFPHKKEKGVNIQ